MKYLFGFGLVAVLFCQATSAFAHFVWLEPEPTAAGTHVRVYFSDQAAPDDPKLLAKLAGAQAWSARWRGEPAAIPLSSTETSLEGTAPADGNGTIYLTHEYGVLSKGGAPFSLKYYAKTYQSPLVGLWKPVGDAKKLPFELTPRLSAEGQLQVLASWQGKPAAQAEIVMLATSSQPKAEGHTDAAGVWTVPASHAGRYALRAKWTEDVAGVFQKQAYTSVRHYSTVTFEFSPAVVAAEVGSLPELEQGTTSFGAAIANDVLYVYGGNYGDAHSYSNEGQSGDLWTLNLKQPAGWQRLTGGPKRQGLALVAHQGRVYRIGGFEATNVADEEERLVSQADFARLSADGASWESLPSLPQGRSSHDAAVVGNTVYVVGGWAMNGGGRNAEWHTSLLAFDLAASDGQWRTCAAPTFTRRALAVAAWNNKLVVIGGMNQGGGACTEMEIYDPATNAWSQGPSILGSPMDGFGCSAYALGEQLVVTTFTGSIQTLRPDQQGWQYAGQLKHRRFFHRLLPMEQNAMVVVGGSNMEAGKVTLTEVLKLADRAQPADAAPAKTSAATE